MKKKIFIILFIYSIVTSVFAETLAYKLKGELKSLETEAIEVSATPLIGNKEIVKSK